MDLLKNLLAYKNDRFNIWNANMEGRDAIAVSLIGNTKTPAEVRDYLKRIQTRLD